MLLCGPAAYCQLNVQLLHQLVDESKSEHSRQRTARDRQATVTASEEVNRSQTATLKERYRRLQKRFHTVALIMDAAGIAGNALPLLERTLEAQQQILDLATDHPILMPLALSAEKNLADHARQLIGYLYGLSVSVGDLNRMNTSDRRMLFGHVISELRKIASASENLARSMLYSTMEPSVSSPFGDFINQDKRMVDNILRRMEELKK